MRQRLTVIAVYLILFSFMAVLSIIPRIVSVATLGRIFALSGALFIGLLAHSYLSWIERGGGLANIGPMNPLGKLKWLVIGISGVVAFGSGLLWSEIHVKDWLRDGGRIAFDIRDVELTFFGLMIGGMMWIIRLLRKIDRKLPDRRM